MSEEIKNVENEVFIKLGYKRGYNLGKFGDIKEYVVELSGNQSTVEEQLKNHRSRLSRYIKEVEGLVEDAHKYNVEKAKAEQALSAVVAEEPKK